MPFFGGGGGGGSSTPGAPAPEMKIQYAVQPSLSGPPEGHTERLSDEIKAALLEGLAAIRACSGWENFTIPAYVWEYVNQAERDFWIGAIYDRIITAREGNSDPKARVADDPDRKLTFAFIYACTLWSEWWIDIPPEGRPEGADHGAATTFMADAKIPTASVVPNSAETNDSQSFFDIYAPCDAGSHCNRYAFELYANVGCKGYIGNEVWLEPDAQFRRIAIWADADDNAYCGVQDYGVNNLQEMPTETQSDPGVLAAWDPFPPAAPEWQDVAPEQAALMRLSTDDGATWGATLRFAGQDGTPAPNPKMRYSANGTDWHETPAGGDTLMSISPDDGTTWSAPIPLSDGKKTSGSLSASAAAIAFS